MSRGRRRTVVGHVVGRAMDKTAVVTVETRRAHPLYKKIVRRQVKFKAHDENNTSRVGDTVIIVESHPIAKSKHWRVAEIVARADIVEVKRDDPNI
jgi:small subunit ribosomal protein S17